MSKIEYLIVPKGTIYTGSGKLGLNGDMDAQSSFRILRKWHCMNVVFKHQHFAYM